MTFYQELQLSSTGSKQLIKNTTDPKEKRRHILIYNFKVYLVMIFCVAVVSLYSKFIGNDNSVVGVTVLLAVLVLRQADFGIRTSHGLLSIAGIFAPTRSATAAGIPNNPAAMDNAPKVLNTVCHAYPAEYPTPIPPIIPIYGYIDSGSTRYSTINIAQPTILNCHLLPDLATQSSVNGRHTDIQAIPAHIALGSPRRFINSIALDTMNVSFRYHLPRAE
jgi:hypothetical protein